MIPLLAQAPPSAGAGEFWVFIFVGALALGSALAMVLMRNSVHAALMLVVNFFAIAVLYAVLEAQFLAVVQIIVYAGAIVVLFLFVLMLLGVGGGQRFSETIRGQKTAAVLLGLAVLVLVGGAVVGPHLGEDAACNVAGSELCAGLTDVNEEGNVRGVGLLLFTDFVWPFEVMSVLLVIAAVGAMVLGKRSEDPADVVDQGEPGVPAAQPPGQEPPGQEPPAGAAPGPSAAPGPAPGREPGGAYRAHPPSQGPGRPDTGGAS